MAKRYLRRRLKKANGAPRLGVQAVLWNIDSGTKYDVDVSDDTPGEEGLVRLNTTNVPEGLYEIRYYGDGIKPTRRDKDGSVVFEDPVTPWELNLFIQAYKDTEPPTIPEWDTPAIVQETNGSLTLNWLPSTDPASGVDGYSIFRVSPEYVIHGEGTYTGAGGIFTDDEDPGWGDLAGHTFIDNPADVYGANGTGTLNTLTDVTKSWGIDDHIGKVLVDADYTKFDITDNDATTLTVAGTPTSGPYYIMGSMTVYTILSNTSNTVTVDMSGKPDPANGRYTIFTGVEPAEGAYLSLDDTEDETQLTYTDKAVNHQYLYWYRLRAHDKDGNKSDLSESRFGISSDVEGPGIIRNLTADAHGIGMVVLAWDEPFSEYTGGLHYNIIYCDIPVVGPPQTPEANLVWKNPFSSTFYGPDGTYSGGGIWTDGGTPNWETDEHKGRILVDATAPEPIRFEITANTASTLTLDLTPGTPVSGEYHIIGDTTVPLGTSGVEDHMAVSYTEDYSDYGVFVDLDTLENNRVYLVRAVDEANNYGPWQQVYEYTPNVDALGYQPGDGVPPAPPVIFDIIPGSKQQTYTDETGNVRLRWKAPTSIDRAGYRIFIKYNSSAEEWYFKDDTAALEIHEGAWITGTGIMQNAFYDSTVNWEAGEDASGGEHAWNTLHFTDPNVDKRFIIEYNTEKHLHLLPGQGIVPAGDQPYRIIPDIQETEVGHITDNGEYKFMMRTIDSSNMVSADSNVILVNINDTTGPEAPNKPDVASLRGGVLIRWTDVPDWGNNFTLTSVDDITVQINDHSNKGWAPNEWTWDYLISPNRSNPRIKKSYKIIGNGSSWLRIRLRPGQEITDLSEDIYSISREDILHNHEYKYELWRSPKGSGWDFNGNTKYDPVDNNCELVERLFLSKNGYFFTQYRDWDYIEDGSIPLENTIWSGTIEDHYPYLADDGEDNGKVYYAIRAIDEDDNVSDFSLISNWVKANLVYERTVKGVIDFGEYAGEHFLYFNKLPPINPSEWFTDWVENDLKLISGNPLDDHQLSLSIAPHKGEDGTVHVPLAIVQLKTNDIFAEDIEIYWRQYYSDGVDRVPQILRIPLTSEGDYEDIEWTITRNVILSNTMFNYEYEFKVRVIDEFGNTSDWNPLIGWFRFLCGLDHPPMWPMVAARLISTSVSDIYP